MLELLECSIEKGRAGKLDLGVVGHGSGAGRVDFAWGCCFQTYVGLEEVEGEGVAIRQDEETGEGG